VTYRAAVVGCGRIGSTLADDPLLAGDVMTHAEAYSVCPDTELVAIVDTDATARQKCLTRWKVAGAYDSVASMMISAKPEIVSVCTPTSTHFSVAKELLESAAPPRAIICEKPVAESLDDAETLVRMAKEANVLLVVMHMRRYARNIQKLREFLRSGGIGDLRGVSGWLTKGTLHNGTHWFDLLRFLIGDVTQLHALNMLGETGQDPTLDVALRLENGMLATMRAADAGNFTLCEMDILGSTGRVRIVDSSYRVELSLAVASSRYTGYVELKDEPTDFGDRKDVMLHAVQDIVACLKTGATPISSGEDGVEALRIALAAHESGKTGELVDLGKR
jgi:predicted dehydrogenase